MVMLGRFLLICVAMAASALTGCTEVEPRSPVFACPAVSDDSQGAEADAIDVDIYLDATTSMEGYVGRETEYGAFLYDLEAALRSRWREADVEFYRFGTRVDSVGREAYLRAREDLGFYKQRGLLERTNIDSVLVLLRPRPHLGDRYGPIPELMAIRTRSLSRSRVGCSSGA